MNKALSFKTYTGPDSSDAWASYHRGEIDQQELRARAEEELASRYITEAGVTLERACMALVRAQSYRRIDNGIRTTN